MAAAQKKPVEIQQTKRRIITVRKGPLDTERGVRQMLANKVSGSGAGLWLLVPELQRLGAWELVTGFTGAGDREMAPRVALQMVYEAALCTPRVRKKNSLCHQGFSLAAGLDDLISDGQVHRLLDTRCTGDVRQLLINLGWQRRLLGHYRGQLVAVDPHRIRSRSKRVMPKKKKGSAGRPQKMLQTFFSVCAHTGQPIMASLASTGMPTGLVTQPLLEDTHQILRQKMLLVADKEHFTQQLLGMAGAHPEMDLLVPAPQTKRIQSILEKLSYRTVSPGYAYAESSFSFAGSNIPFRLVGQRTAEIPDEYTYQGFVTTSDKDPIELLCRDYVDRWSVEEFFRFENMMGLNRASTLNLNIRYGRLALAMIAQAATYQLRGKLKAPYQRWDAQHLASQVLAWADGDIRVRGDTIVVRFYGDVKHINPVHYRNLPTILQAEGIDPRIPWLYNFKLDFRFK